MCNENKDVRHTFSEYAELLKDRELFVSAGFYGRQDENIRYISYDSRDIVKDTLFVCKGIHFREEYLKSALEKGASGYVSEKEYDIGREVPHIIVKDIKMAMPVIARYFYNDVCDFLNIAGVTGTKGKSTTTYFIKNILDRFLISQGKKKAGLISSIKTYDGISKEDAVNTTPEALELHKYLKNAYDSGLEYFALEVSSQAVKYYRTEGIKFDTVCFLNIGHDHVSALEHPDFEDYFSSKLALFKQCRKAVINTDCDHADRIKKEALKYADEVITFGCNEKDDVYGYDIRSGRNGISFRVRTDDFDEGFIIRMRGLFNVSNALAAIAVCREYGVPKEYIKAGLEATIVDGRMELYRYDKKDIDIIVDYAHNELSFESVFRSTMQEFPGKKISIVFGCVGGKAYDRRKGMGETAGRYADHVYLTEDDPAEESVKEISEEVAGYIKIQGHAEYSIIEDREEAIKTAIDNAEEGSVVIIAGKGRETHQKRGTMSVPVRSDIECVEMILQNRS